MVDSFFDPSLSVIGACDDPARLTEPGLLCRIVAAAPTFSVCPQVSRQIPSIFKRLFDIPEQIFPFFITDSFIYIILSQRGEGGH